MPSRKGLDQALTWLKSKMAEKDTLDAINAEVTYNVLMDIQKKRQVIGALYHQSYTAKRNAEEKLQEMEMLQLEESIKKMFYPEEGPGEAG